MLDKQEYTRVETYVGSETVANSLAKCIVDSGLASTCHVEEVSSLYHWKGRVVSDTELRVSCDVPAERIDDIVNTILDNHPYELPGIFCHPLIPCTPAIAKWLRDPA